MSIIATAVRHLLAAGVTGEALVEAIAEMEAAAPAPVDPVAEKRRAYDRERKAKARADAKSGGSPVESADITDKADAAPLALPPKDNNSNPPTHTPEHTPRARGPWDAHVSAWLDWRKKNPFPKPSWTDEQTWRDFKANRKAKRLPCTPSAHARLLRDIERLSDDEWPPGRLFEEIVARGWAAAHDPRETRKLSHDRPSRRPQPSRDNRDPYTQLLDERLGIGNADQPPGEAGRSDAGGRAGHREHVAALARNRG